MFDRPNTSEQTSAFANHPQAITPNPNVSPKDLAKAASCKESKDLGTVAGLHQSRKKASINERRVAGTDPSDCDSPRRKAEMRRLASGTTRQQRDHRSQLAAKAESPRWYQAD